MPAWTPYEAGYNARLRNCYRALACPESADEEREWLRGWDDADLMRRLDEPVQQDAR